MDGIKINIKNFLIRNYLISEITFKRIRKHWIRVVCDEATERLVREINPELLEVLEISGSRWEKLFQYKNYNNLFYPDFDIQNVDNLEKLAEIKATVGAQINTTSYYFLQKYEGIKIKTYEKFGHAVIDLANKGNDAVVGDSVQVNYYFNKNKQLTQNTRFLGSRLTSEYYGIVLRKDDIELKQKIDAGLTALLKNGTVQKLHDKWNLGDFAGVPLPEQ